MARRLRTPAGLILTPGASADRTNAALVALDDGLPEIEVVRLTLGTTSVPRAVDKIVAAGNDLAAKLDVPLKRISFGGRSFGGRSCSVAVAQGLDAHSLLLLSYPLHPPGKPEKLRVEHFGDIDVPVQFVTGERDPFGTEAEFAAHIPAIAGKVRFDLVPGDHSPKGQDDTILALVRSFFGLPRQ